MTIPTKTESRRPNRRDLAMAGMQGAIAARTKANIDQKSPACVYGICEAHGVTVRFNSINMEGMYEGHPKPRIHVSTLRPLGRRAFTCAHELGHHVFGHGATIDELREDHLRYANRPPQEVLADAFASFLLMPTLGVREALQLRNLTANKASAIDLYAIACNFGVGQATLVNHLAFGVQMISTQRRDELSAFTPKVIRSQLLGRTTPDRLILVDRHWNSPTLDAEQGNLLLLPPTVVVDTKYLTPVENLAAGRLFRAATTGISRIAQPGSQWATYVRISKQGYVGLAKYRHLEECSDA